MASLRERLGSGEARQRVIDDACSVLDQEVQDKSGAGGLIVRGAYTVVKGLKPGFVRQAVDHLLDEFLDALDPIYNEAIEKGVLPSVHLQADRPRYANALLAVTDRRAQKSETGVLRKTYDRLRSAAQKHVEASAPRVGQMLDKHAPKP